MNLAFDVKLKFDDHIWKQMERRLLNFKPKAVRTGWWGSYYPDGISVAQVASWNEEGHMNGGMFAGTITPPRPFIRTKFTPKSKVILKSHAIRFFDYLEGKSTVAAFWKSLEKDLKDNMQLSILEFDSPANSITTVMMKGFNDPLINTGTMYDNVKTKLVNMNTGEE